MENLCKRCNVNLDGKIQCMYGGRIVCKECHKGYETENKDREKVIYEEVCKDGKRRGITGGMIKDFGACADGIGKRKLGRFIKLFGMCNGDLRILEKVWGRK